MEQQLYFVSLEGHREGEFVPVGFYELRTIKNVFGAIGSIIGCGPQFYGTYARPRIFQAESCTDDDFEEGSVYSMNCERRHVSQAYDEAGQYPYFITKVYKGGILPVK